MHSAAVRGRNGWNKSDGPASTNERVKPVFLLSFKSSEEMVMKKMHGIMGVVLSGLLMAGAMLAPVTAQAADKAKIVVQVSESDPAKWNLVLNNAANLQKDVGKDNIEVEIVAFGPGINMLKADSEVGNRVQEAAEAGVAVMACQNTMRKQKLNKEDMLTTVGYVPSGVVEIMRKQQQGYAYLRP